MQQFDNNLYSTCKITKDFKKKIMALNLEIECKEATSSN